MKLLLCKNVSKLGIVGDIVEVRPGYARNYLVPRGLATEPTAANIRVLAADRRVAEEERAKERVQLESLAKRLADVEITIRARANEIGHLYGSVGRREIAAALADEGFYVDPDYIALGDPIRQLDNVAVEVRLADDLRSTIKVWVVREKVEGESDEAAPEAASGGMEAGRRDHGNHK